MREQLVFSLGEIRQGDINKVEFIAKQLVTLIFEMNPVDGIRDALFLIFVKLKIQNADGVNSGQLVIPIAFNRLLLNRKSGIKQAAILEIILLGLLHFDNKSLATGTAAGKIENCLAINSSSAQLLAIGIVQISDLMVIRQQAIQEINQQRFIRVFAEQFFKAEIGKRIDLGFFGHDLS